MARLVTKFKYLKPGARTGVGGYAKYIATRERCKLLTENMGKHTGACRCDREAETDDSKIAQRLS